MRNWLKPWVLTIAFGILAIVAVFLATAWEVPSQCHVSINCVKGYEWHTDGGRYYHVIEGVTTEISQQTYTEEIGVDLRSAAAFGIYALLLAFIAATGLRPPSPAPQLKG